MQPSRLKSNSPVKIWAVLGGIVVVIAGILGYGNLGKNNPTVTDASTDTAPSSDTSSTNQTSQTNQTVTTKSTKPVSVVQSNQSQYKNGTYSAEGTYISPSGGEKVKVTLTLKDSVVTASTFTPEASSPESARYQNRFASGYQQYVVGKNIDQINVGRVSGSSLTGQGFNDAVAQIKAEAKA